VRIAFVTHAYTPAVGGAERYGQSLAEAFVRTGHEVHVLTPNRISAESFYEFGYGPAGATDDDINGVRVHRLELRTPRSWWRRTAQVGPIPPEDAHIMWDEYGSQVDIELDRISPDATVALPHTFPNVSAALNAPSSGVTVYAPLLHEEDPAWQIEPIAELVTKSDVVLAMTAWERDRLVEAYGSVLDQTHVAPPAVDAPAIEAVTSHPHDIPYVVAVGRRTRSKELLTTASAIDSMNEKKQRLRLIVVGPGTDSGLDIELGTYGGSVEVVGEVTEGLKWQLIKGSIASVSMSASESFGFGITEAWSMSRPAIARRLGSTESVVDDGVDGFLVDNEQELIEKLEGLIGDPSEADRMGATGNRKLRSPRDSSASTILSAISAALDRRYNHPINGGA
jgi:glycosyltransferase involved in cell wall biosynthesis